MKMARINSLVELGVDLVNEGQINREQFEVIQAGRLAMDLLAELHHGKCRENIYIAIDRLLEEYHQ